MSNIQVTNIKNLSGNNTVAISSASGDLIVKNDLIAESAVEISGTITANSSGLEVLGISTLTELVVNDVISIGQSVSIASGIITATSFVGDGSGITGIITNVEAGANVTIVENPAGNFIITSTLSQLSEDLNLGTNNIIGTGNIDIVGLVSATSFVGNGSGLTDVVINSQLSEDLDLGVNDIIGTGNIDIVGLVSATSFTGNGSNLSGVVTSLLLTGENGITVSSVGTAYTISSNFNSVADDTAPQLGGELDLNSNNITGIGTINIDGEITGTTLNGNLVAPNSLSVGNDISFTGLTARISATSFVGDGPGLTGVIGPGSGEVIKDNDTTVGTAGTINFGPSFNVSPTSAGIVTVTSGIEIKDSGSSLGTGITGIDFSTNLTATASGGIATITASGGGGSGTGYFSNDQSNSGIHTTAAHVGLGTTNPSTSVQINDVYGIETESGTFTATAGVAYTANTYAVADFVNAEYTLFFQHSSGIQSQKVLIMDDGTTAYAQEYGIMSSNDLLVSVGATVKSGNVELEWTPETGVSGVVTYRYIRETMI